MNKIKVGLKNAESVAPFWQFPVKLFTEFVMVSIVVWSKNIFFDLTILINIL